MCYNTESSDEAERDAIEKQLRAMLVAKQHSLISVKKDEQTNTDGPDQLKPPEDKTPEPPRP